MTATVVAAHQDGTYAYASVSVAESFGLTEYFARTPLHDGQGSPLPAATVKANLIAALQAVRNANLPPTINTVAIGATVVL